MSYTSIKVARYHLVVPMNSKFAALIWFFMALFHRRNGAAPHDPYFSILVAACVAHSVMAAIDILALCELSYADIAIIVAIVVFLKLNGIIDKYPTYARTQQSRP